MSERLIDRMDKGILEVFEFHGRHPIALYFWGILTGVLLALKFMGRLG